ncbi:MAG: DUF5682 family protein [Gemmataceae bacterium]
MLTPDPETLVKKLLPQLRSKQVTYFPIRHHSPACAAHIHRWIETHKPASVLIEGPESFDSFVGLLTQESCVCPVAIYTSFVDKKGRLRPKLDIPEQEEANGASPLPEFPEARFAAYYPFCDYSPEFVALRSGHAVDARIRFIDLEYPEKILAKHKAERLSNKDGVAIDLLAADPHLMHSEYVEALARRLGCRDFNELWDHLFEAQWDALSTEVFIDRVATWCLMARLSYTEEVLECDGTIAREACMAAAIIDEMEKTAGEKRRGPLLVVTGGFHTVVLPELVAKKTKRPKGLSVKDDECGSWLMRYSYDQLDSLAGYQSGMPNPAFYERMWNATQEAIALGEDVGSDQARTLAAADILVEIGRKTREGNIATRLSTPDAIAAVQMTKELAKLRGHPWPLREDVLDGIRSCFVKGEVDAEGQFLLQLVQRVLAGNRIGQTPPESGVPPIVDDFYREARRLRITLDKVERRETTLDLYRKANHREMSRLFHRLTELGVDFAVFTRGPDFVSGHGLDLMIEHWQVCWSPSTESALIEASIYGPTIEAATGNRLRQQIAQLEDEGMGRSTAAAVEMLIRACRLGLHEQTPAIAKLVGLHIAEDPLLPSVTEGLSQLELLGSSREPLEATNLTAIPSLVAAAYQRACHLMGEIPTCPDDAVTDIIRSLSSLREVVANASPSTETAEDIHLDTDLFYQSLRRVVEHPPDEAQPAIVGAAAGILYGEGQIGEVELIAITGGFLSGTSDPSKSCGILRGLLATAREVAWQVTKIVQAIDEQFNGWDDETFLQALPELRLAFADLTPREISNVADLVANMHGESTLGELVHMDLDEEEVQFALSVTQLVRETLQADGFEKWQDKQ